MRSLFLFILLLLISANMYAQETTKNKLLSYKNGFWGVTIKQGTKKLSTGDIKKLYVDVQPALSKYKKGKALNAVGTIMAIPSGIVFGYGVGLLISGQEINKTVYIISAAGLFTGILFHIGGESMIKSSVNIYNADIDKTSSLNIKFGVMQNGLGFCLTL